MTPGTRNSAIAALIIMFGFGIVAYFLPSIMLFIGGWSTTAAAIVAIAFVLAFFGVFWLRGRSQGGDR